MDESLYVRVYDGFLDEYTCDSLIENYERLLKEEEKKLKQNTLCFDPNGTKLCSTCDCMRIDMMQHEVFEQPFQLIMNRLQLCIEQYKKDVDVHPVQWPKSYGYENLKLKRYLCDGIQQHALHADVTNWHDAKRFLAIICYLNDDFDDGETEFPRFGFKIEPKKGRCAMFPPLWSYLHAGLPPTNGFAKYIIGTHLNYIDAPMTLRQGDLQNLGAKIGGVKVV